MPPPESVSCVNVVYLGVLDHDLYCVVVAMCVKLRHPLPSFEDFSCLKATSVTQGYKTYIKANNTAIGSLVVSTLQMFVCLSV